MALGDGRNHAVSIADHVAVFLEVSTDVAVGLGGVFVERQYSVSEGLEKELPRSDQSLWRGTPLRAGASLRQGDGANVQVGRREPLQSFRKAEAAFEDVRASVGVE
jgi:hypothetical protein